MVIIAHISTEFNANNLQHGIHNVYVSIVIRCDLGMLFYGYLINGSATERMAGDKVYVQQVLVICSIYTM